MTPAIEAAKRAGITFELHEYEGVEVGDGDYATAVAEALDRPPAQLYKTLVAKVDGELAVFVIPADRQLDLRAVGKRAVLAAKAGFRLPVTSYALQAFVTEPLKPLLDVVVVSSQMHVYISQTDRGEFLIGAEIEPYTTYKSIGTFPFLEYSARHVLELFPQLERLRVLRTWTGLCDLSPDYSPILGRTELENFHVSAGWGTYGFKAAPIVGTTLAELVATGKTPELIAPFALERFHTDTLVSELAAAAVSH